MLRSFSPQILLEKEISHRPLVMFAFSLVNYLVFYGVNIFLARQLTVAEFDDYNVGVSLTLLFATIVTLGLEKYALLCLPSYQERELWALSRGFIHYACQVCVLFSFGVILLIFLTMESLLPVLKAESYWSILLIIGFLPILSLFLLHVELITAYGRAVEAVMVYRLLLPLLVAGLNLAVWMIRGGSSAYGAVFSLGVSWCLVLLVACFLLRQVIPLQVLEAKSESRHREWTTSALPLLASSSMLTMISHSGVIILGLFHPSEASVSSYALAFQTGTFLILLGTSTNRFYLPLVSQFLARNDLQGLWMLARQRMRIIAPLTALFLLCVVLFGRLLLGLFGTTYQEGYPALILISIGASVGTLYSAVPYYLQYANESTLVLRWTAAAMILTVFSSIPLSIRLEATGAAIGYALPLSVLYLAMATRARKNLRRRRQLPG